MDPTDVRLLYVLGVIACVDIWALSMEPAPTVSMVRGPGHWGSGSGFRV